MTRKSRREIERELEDRESRKFEGYPTVSLAELLSADVIREIEATSGGCLLEVDGTTMAIRSERLLELYPTLGPEVAE